MIPQHEDHHPEMAIIQKNPLTNCGRNIVPVVRDEQAWQTKLLRVKLAGWGFFAGREARPEICYEAASINYLWRRDGIYRSGS